MNTYKNNISYENISISNDGKSYGSFLINNEMQVKKESKQEMIPESHIQTRLLYVLASTFCLLSILCWLKINQMANNN